MYSIGRFAAATFFLFLSALPALAQQQGDWRGWGYPGWGWGHMMFGGLMMIVFWGGIILLIVLLVRWLGAGAPPAGPAAGRATPLDILNERFARGEIDQKEYEERKRVLSQ